MTRRFVVLSVFAVLLAAARARAEPVRVVATLPDVGSIAESVGGGEVAVTVLARGYEDPHYVTPTPALMTAASRAELYLEIGLSLEIWSERVLDGARNPKVRVGAPGHQFVSAGVAPKEVPAVVTRGLGDLHAEGNPHIWLDPLNGLVMARNIRDALIRVAPDRRAAFERGYEAFELSLCNAVYGEELVGLFGGPLLVRLDQGNKLLPFLEKKVLEGRPLVERLGGLHGRARAFRGKPIVFFHRSWIYFADRFGLSIRGYVEDKPGIAPSAKHRDEMIELIRNEKIPVVAVTSFHPRRVPEAIAAATGARLVVVPSATGGEQGAGDYLSFLKLLVDRLAAAYEES